MSEKDTQPNTQPSVYPTLPVTEGTPPLALDQVVKQPGAVVPQLNTLPAIDIEGIIPPGGAKPDETLPVVPTEQLGPRPKKPPGWHQDYVMGP